MSAEVGCADELYICSQSTSDSCYSNELSRSATMKIEIHFLRKILGFASWTWFKQYISGELGVIHDCYISEYDANTNKLDSLGIEEGSDTVCGLHHLTED